MISPPPSSIFCSSQEHYIDHAYLASVHNVNFQGMTTMIIAPLTTIKQQIEDDCRLYGISALVGDQVKFVCSMIFRSSVNHETISVAFRLIKWSLQLDLTQIPINSLAGELRKRPQILIVSAEFLASIEVVPCYRSTRNLSIQM